MPSPWIRGVNIGGWLLLERFISPYLFAITDCHLRGDFCWYNKQIGAPKNTMNSSVYKECDYTMCKPILVESPLTDNKLDFPVDQYSLMSQFNDSKIAAQFLEYHYDNMVTRDDIQKLAISNVSHVRVPLPHWILGDISYDEPYVHDNAWFYFKRLCDWCRLEKIQVWPDLHTAPGSQNGFDNAGQVLRDAPTCVHWSNNSMNVARTQQIVVSILHKIRQDNLTDVVTGFGILNEPYRDCNITVMKQYTIETIAQVKRILGEQTAVYVGDMFNVTQWNDGTYLANVSNAFLDSHYYHVFAEEERALSPRQHIAYVCQKQAHDVEECCYSDAPHNNKLPLTNVSRVIGEWSAVFDTLVVEKLQFVMNGILKNNNGVAPELTREISSARRDFLKQFVKAQMVVYEAASKNVSRGWFFWTLKTEGGAFAEWDFLRGLQEGWIPNPLPSINTSSESVFGSCYDIMFQTTDDMSIVHEYPDPSSSIDTWHMGDIDDDVVVTHGESLNMDKKKKSSSDDTRVPPDDDDTTTTTTDKHKTTTTTAKKKRGGISFFSLLAIVFFAWAIKRVFFTDYNPLKRSQYSQVGGGDDPVTMAV